MYIFITHFLVMGKLLLNIFFFYFAFKNVLAAKISGQMYIIKIHK